MQINKSQAETPPLPEKQEIKSVAAPFQFAEVEIQEEDISYLSDEDIQLPADLFPVVDPDHGTDVIAQDSDQTEETEETEESDYDVSDHDMATYDVPADYIATENTLFRSPAFENIFEYSTTSSSTVVRPTQPLAVHSQQPVDSTEDSTASTQHEKKRSLVATLFSCMRKEDANEAPKPPTFSKRNP